MKENRVMRGGAILVYSEKALANMGRRYSKALERVRRWRNE